MLHIRVSNTLPAIAQLVLLIIGAVNSCNNPTASVSEVIERPFLMPGFVVMPEFESTDIVST